MFIIDRTQLPPSDLTEFLGRDHDAGTSLIFVDIGRDGDGPALHKHPYSETFIILDGEAHFTVGNDDLTGVAGQVIIEPSSTPHRFAKTGPAAFA